MGEHLEHELGPRQRQVHIAQFVDDEQLHGLQFALKLQQLLLIAGSHEPMHQGGGGGESDGEALLAGGKAKGELDVGFAGSTVAERDDVLTTQDELAAPQIEHQRARLIRT